MAPKMIPCPMWFQAKKKLKLDKNFKLLHTDHNFLSTKLRFALRLKSLKKLRYLPKISSDEHGS